MAMKLGDRCKNGHFLTAKTLRTKTWNGKTVGVCLVCRSEGSRKRYATDPEYRERRLQANERCVEKRRNLYGKLSMRNRIKKLLEDIANNKAEMFYVRYDENNERYYCTVRQNPAVNEPRGLDQITDQREDEIGVHEAQISRTN